MSNLIEFDLLIEIEFIHVISSNSTYIFYDTICRFGTCVENNMTRTNARVNGLANVLKNRSEKTATMSMEEVQTVFTIL